MIVSGFFVAELSDSHSEGMFPTEFEARTSYEQEIKRLREIDPEDPVAGHLQGILDRVRSREQIEMDKAEAFRGKAEEFRRKWDEESQADFEKPYDEAKTQRISELTQFGVMTLEQAEQQLQQIEHASLSASLKRHHGIAA